MRASASVLSFVFVASACAARPPPSPPRTTHLALGVERYELSNGLKVVVVHDPVAAEVQVTMRYRVGSVDDPTDQAGLAHLVEHLMFQQVVGERAIFARLQDHATAFNAYTSFDATTFVARARPDRLDELLSIEGIRMQLRCASVTDSVFEREREVVINELHQRDAATAVRAALHAGLFPEAHAYRRPIGGTEDSVGALTRAQACGFADAHYVPRNAVLVVSGPVTGEALQPALRRFFARVPDRAPAARVPVARIAPATQAVQVTAPVDGALVAIAWRLPDDLGARSRMRAIASAVEAAIDRRVRGPVVRVELGDERDPWLAFVELPTDDEDALGVVRELRKALDDAPAEFLIRGPADRVAFNRRKQTAIYALFAGLDAGASRDLELATRALAGDDPAVAVGREIGALRTMSREQAAAIAREQFAFDHARIAMVSGARAPASARTLRPPVHDLGLGHDQPDVADAARPAGEPVAPPALGVERHVLPNGLEVVLIQASSVPVVDVRLVFHSGTADEPPDRRGAALVAGYGLQWDLRYLNDLLALSEAGGNDDVEVGPDRIAFRVTGLDMHLDYLLAGLRRWVRDGRYDATTAIALGALRRLPKQADADAALTDAWRAAIYGDRHPYVRGGLARHLDRALAIDDVRRFRARHFTPRNATLVIAGRFDAALAQRWIDFLFGDWTGPEVAHDRPAAVVRPVALARDDERVQLEARIALPATAGGAAEREVAAELLAEIAGDVRHQLGASYGLDTALVAQRASVRYEITGLVDAARAGEALALLRDRLDALRADRELAARAFVRARRRAMIRLANATTAGALAGEVEHDVALGRAPLTRRDTARAVHELVIARMDGVLAELDLRRAAIALRGPPADVDRAYEAIGRTPVRVAAPRATAAAAPPRADEDPLERLDLPDDFADALTLQLPEPLSLAVTPGFAIGSAADVDLRGLSVTGQVGYRATRSETIGGYASIGRLAGTADAGDLTLLPLAIGGFVQSTGYDRLWGAASAGVRLARVAPAGAAATWHTSFGVGFELGVELYRRAPHRFGAFARFDLDVASDLDYLAGTFGIAYRR